MATVSDVVASRPVVALLSVVAGSLAGATLTSPAVRRPNVDVSVHAVRIERPTPGATPPTVHAEVYAIGSWEKPDGGRASRDFGPSRCSFTSAQNPGAVGRLVQLTNAAAARCDAGQGASWPHVTEVLGTSVNNDAGYMLRVYTSRPLADGGVLDLGQAPVCPSWVGGLPAALEDVVLKLALRCAEDRLEESLP